MLCFLGILCIIMWGAPICIAGDTLRFPILTNTRFPAKPTDTSAAVSISQGQSFARLILCVRLACPCGPGLGEWDYTVRFLLSNPTGRSDSLGNPIRQQWEIARFITPYAGNRPSSWNWTWQWDITDYRFLFTDSTKIVVHYSGWTQSALFTVWIDAITGTPPYEVFAFEELIEGFYPYGNPNDPIDRYTTGKHFHVPLQAELVKLKIVTTGHGFGGTDNAAEFAEKTHTVLIDGRERFRHHLWRDDCGWNPVYPQDGTWPLARAGWCPGDVVHPWERWITKFVQAGAEGTFDYRMQPFVNHQFDRHPSSYLITTHILYARAPSLLHRVSLLSIQTPNDAPHVRRLNPTCGRPTLVIRNDGRDSVLSLLISYQLDNQPVQLFQWIAPIPLGLRDTAHIELPVMVGVLDTPMVRRLQVHVTMVNSQPNQEQFFNRAVATFSDVPTIPGDSVVVLFRTTLYAREQGLAWTLRRLDDQSLIAERRDLDGGIIDTARLRLDDGCYKFRFDNPAGYGLAWWATQQQLGTGSLSLIANGKRVVTLDGDCGNGYIYNFRVGPVPHVDVSRDTINFGATPVGVPIQRQRIIKPATSAYLHIRQIQLSSIPANLGFRIVDVQPPLHDDRGVWLQPGQQMVITLEYKPPQEETRVRSATLSITTNDYDEPTIRIPLRGTTPNVTNVVDQSHEPLFAVPNPSSDYVRIELPLPLRRWRIIASTGEDVSMLTVCEDVSHLELDVRRLANGLYAALLETGNGTFVYIPFVVCCR